MEVHTGHEAVDYIAQDAADGALRADVAGNVSILSFGHTSSDAGDTAAAYEAFGVSGEKLRQKGNAVIAWSNTPTDEQRGTVEGCLGDG